MPEKDITEPIQEEQEKVEKLDTIKARRAVAKARRQLAKHVWATRAAIVALAVALALFLFAVGVSLIGQTEVGYYGRLAKNFLLPPPNALRQYEDRTNVLILGKAGEGFTAPDLTDTIIFASFNHSDPADVSLVSLPRDIWFPDLKAKLNSVYYWGNEREEGGGLVLAKSSVEEIVGVPVHYAVVIDFSGFQEVIDEVGGVDVMVEKSFIDEKFPIPGKEDDECEGDDPEYLCRYETISFEEGLTHMDGETALKFARSRHSEDLEEGTDIARSARQQKMLEALGQKITQRDFLTSPQKMTSLWKIFLQIIETDIPEEYLPVLARLGFNARENIKSNALPEDLLVNPPISPVYDNLYVFVPANEEESWGDVHTWVKGILD